MGRNRREDPRTTALLRKLRGKLFRASCLLERPSSAWRRRRLLDRLEARAERVESRGGTIIVARTRVPYAGAGNDTPVYPGSLRPRREDLPAMASLAGERRFARATLGRIAVIDTETTGLLDKAETVAFLIGIGRFGTRAFAIEQYFIEDYESECEMARLFVARMAAFRAILTFNGATFDLPLLRRRLAIQRISDAALDRPHWDVLHTVRLLWPRGSCSLVGLERAVFGFRRRRDVHSARIPSIYREYLGGKRAERLAAVFDHNAQDILTTAALAVALARLLRARRRLSLHALVEGQRLRDFLERFSC